jgi:hypothetical protein
MRHQVIPVAEHAVHGVDLVDLRRHTIEEEQMAGCGVELGVLGVRAAVRTRVDKGHDVVRTPEATVRPRFDHPDAPLRVV